MAISKDELFGSKKKSGSSSRPSASGNSISKRDIFGAATKENPNKEQAEREMAAWARQAVERRRQEAVNTFNRSFASAGDAMFAETAAREAEKARQFVNPSLLDMENYMATSQGRRANSVITPPAPVEQGNGRATSGRTYSGGGRDLTSDNKTAGSPFIAPRTTPESRAMADRISALPLDQQTAVRRALNEYRQNAVEIYDIDSYRREHENMAPDEHEKYARQVELEKKNAKIEELIHNTFGNVDVSKIDLSTIDLSDPTTISRALFNADDARVLLDYQQRQANAEIGVKKAQKIAERVKERPFGMNLASVLVEYAAPLDLGELIASRASGRPLDVNNMAVTQFRDTVRSATSDKIAEESGSNLLNFLYQTGISMADFTALLPTAGSGQAISLGLMGTNAGLSTIKDAKERGLSDDAAIGTGILAGVFEALFEKLSLETLINPGAAKSRISYILKNVLAEGSEEVATELANFTADNLLNGGLSEYNQRVRYYISQEKMSPEDAKRAAKADFAKQFALAGAGGALSGGLLGAFSAAFNSDVKAQIRANANPRNGLGRVGNLQFERVFDKEQRNSPYLARDFMQIYNAGVRGNEAQAQSLAEQSELNEVQATAAYYAGVQDAENGSVNIDRVITEEYNNNYEGTTDQYERTTDQSDNQFREIQEASRAESFADIKEQNRYVSEDEGLRQRLEDVFRGELVSRGYSDGDGKLYDLNDGKGNIHPTREVDAETFHDFFEIARKYTRNGELVDLHPVKTTEDTTGYEDCSCHLSNDGMSGYAITKSGDLISVFNASAKKGYLRAIAPEINKTAKTLDCYMSPEQPLNEMYERVLGWKTASEMDWNPEYDHDEIGQNHKSPRVAFMVNTNDAVETRNFDKDDYDGAKSYRDSLITQAKEENNASSENTADSSERNGRVGPGEQTEGVESRSGETESKRPGGREESVKARRSRFVAESGQPLVSTRQRGIQNGTDSQTFRVVSGNMIKSMPADMKQDINAVRQQFKANKARLGLRSLTFVDGKLEAVDRGITARGDAFVTADGDVYINISSNKDITKVFSHEEGHALWRQNQRGGKALKNFKKFAVQTNGQEALDNAVRAYAHAYYGATEVDSGLYNYLVQEIYCDARAGLNPRTNTFSEAARLTEESFATRVSNTAAQTEAQAPQTAVSENETRGSPEETAENPSPEPAETSETRTEENTQPQAETASEAPTSPTHNDLHRDVDFIEAAHNIRVSDNLTVSNQRSAAKDIVADRRDNQVKVVRPLDNGKTLVANNYMIVVTDADTTGAEGNNNPNSFDYAGFMDNVARASERTLKVPTLQELRYALKVLGKRDSRYLSVTVPSGVVFNFNTVGNNVVADLGENVWVNAKYLYNAITLLGNPEDTLINGKDLRSPIYLRTGFGQDSDNRAVVLPVNHDVADSGTRFYRDVDEYFEQGPNAYRDIKILQGNIHGEQVTKATQTIAESALVTDEQAAAIKSEAAGTSKFTYTPQSNPESLSKAQARFDGLHGNVDAAVLAWNDIINSDKFPKPEDIAFGEILIRELSQRGDTDRLIDVAADLSLLATRGGQLVQAVHIINTIDQQYKNSDARFRLKAIENALKGINKLNKKRLGNKFTPAEIDTELRKNLLSAKTPEEIQAAADAILENLAAQLPSTFSDKWNAWRYLSMLGNPRTHIRNIVGNAVFVPAIKIKNAIATGLESRIVKDGKERTKTLRRISPEIRAYSDRAYVRYKDVVQGNSTKYAEYNEIKQKQKIFGEKGPFGLLGKGVNKASAFNSAMLEKEDQIFLRRHFKNALNGYLQANNIDVNSITTEQESKAIGYAIREAQKATYRDASAMATALNRFSRTGKVAGLLTESLIPFKKTPINILKRGVEYSPIGLINTLSLGARDLHSGKITINEWIDGVSSGMTGTLVVALGAFLGALGFLKGGQDDDDLYEKLIGEQPYSVQAFGKSYTLDWAAPMSMPLFVGVNLAQSVEDGGFSFDDIWTVLKDLPEPMIQMSLLQGLNDLISSVRYAEGSEVLGVAAMQIVTGYLSQAFPTIGGQIARTIDETTRRNLTDPNSSVPKDIQYFIQQTMGKIPLMSFSKQPRLNAWGEEDVESNPLLRGFENFMSPGYINDVTENDVEREIKNIAEETGEEVLLPQKIKSSVNVNVDGEQIKLTPQQITDYQKAIGQRSYNTLDAIIKTEAYQKLDVETKSTVIESIYKFVTAGVQYEQFGKEMSNSMFSLYEALSEEEYANYIMSSAKAGFPTKQDDVIDVLEGMMRRKEISKKQAYEIFHSKWKSDKNNPFK